MKAIRMAGIACAALVTVSVVLLFVGIPSGILTTAIQQDFERETGYRITIAGTSRLGLWPGPNVTMTDVTIENPADHDGNNRLMIGNLRADIALASALSGRPQITRIDIDHPQLHIPLVRDRARAVQDRPQREPANAAEAKSYGIERMTVSNGEIVFSNPRDRVEQRVVAIAADITIGSDRQVKATGSARIDDRPIKLSLSAAAPATSGARNTVPVEIAVDAPDLIASTLTSKAEVRLNGAVLMINGLSGAIGDAQFNGWASADLSSKPLVKLDLDFQRLDIGSRSRPPAGADRHTAVQPWSDAPIDLTGLNYFDAQIRFSAAELNVGDAKFAPASVEGTLSQGASKLVIKNLGAYSGTVSGETVVDVSSGQPVMTLRTDLAGVRALPLLTGLADFDRLDGNLQAKIAVRASGASQRALISSLTGTAFVDFRDGAVRGVNIAKMIRTLTSGTLTGWQDGPDQATDLSQMSASFAIENGQAKTSDLALAGPLVRMSGAGTVDLGMKSLALRVDPKLVMTAEGQGGAQNPVGLGIPVVIDGPWAEPRIYPDMAGVLDNPDAAYAKLREMGKGLFGGDGQSNGLGGQLGQTLGTMIQQGLGSGRRDEQSAPDSGSRPSAPIGSSPIDGVLKQLFGR